MFLHFPSHESNAYHSFVGDNTIEGDGGERGFAE